MRDIIQMCNDFYVFLIGLCRQTTTFDAELTKLISFSPYLVNIRYARVRFMTIFAID